MRKLVDLPAPLGPSRPTISASPTRKLTPSTTRRRPYVFCRSQASKTGVPSCCASMFEIPLSNQPKSFEVGSHGYRRVPRVRPENDQRFPDQQIARNVGGFCELVRVVLESTRQPTVVFCTCPTTGVQTLGTIVSHWKILFIFQLERHFTPRPAIPQRSPIVGG